jgi:hypothetical protein
MRRTERSRAGGRRDIGDESGVSDPVTTSSPPLDIASIFGTQVSGESIVRPAEAIEGPRPPFNGLALASVLVPVLVGIIPWLAVGAASDETPALPLELLVGGAVGLGLAIGGLQRARRGTRRNRGLSIAGIVLSTLALVMGIGSFGVVLSEQDEEGRAVGNDALEQIAAEGG